VVVLGQAVAPGGRAVRELAVALGERRAVSWALRLAGKPGAGAGSYVITAPIAGTDQFHAFHAHPEHQYLAGASHPGATLAFDPGEGWTLFAETASEDDRVWSGESEALGSLAIRTGLHRILPGAQLAGWLERRRGEPVAILGNTDITLNPARYGVENWASLELDRDDALAARLSEAVSEARRAKDPAELAFMRGAAAASRAGHLAGIRFVRPGMTERQLQVEIEVEFFRAGSLRTAYGSIVGGGPNAAVLHFAPTSRTLSAGEMVLVDAGAEVEGYASDVTRTYPVGGRFEGVQRDLYGLVLEVQAAAIAAVRPGAEYRDLHMAVSRRIADGLVQLGILRGDPDSLVERDAHALFFPHGLGHMLGLATHDAGGCLAGRERSDRFGLKYLRADLPLAPGHVVTIEPGIYFIRALLQDSKRRRSFADAVDWECVDRLLDFGGIRIEDDVLVTASSPEVLTAAIPKSITAIESLRQEGLDQ